MNNDSARRPTQRDIAKACGVSQMSVSLALRNSPKVSPEVRRRILKAAKELHWKPDPALSALMSYKYRDTVCKNPMTVAWVTTWPDRSGWKDNHPIYLEYFSGAKSRAESMGYRLEEFWLNEPGMTEARLSRILYARGIAGILLPPQPRPQMRLLLAWEKFSTVKFGFTLADPPLHLVTNHHFHSSLMSLRQLRLLGYRRVAIFLDQRYDSRVDYSWMAGCLMEQRQYPPEERLPMVSKDELSREELREYLEQYCPDAVLTNFWDVAGRLKELGYRVPQDIGLAFPSVTDRFPGVAGMNENSFAIGEAAMELLAIMMQRNERGIPKVQRCVMIEGTWRPGGTVRRKRAPASSSSARP